MNMFNPSTCDICGRVKFRKRWQRTDNDVGVTGAVVSVLLEVAGSSEVDCAV